MWGLIGCWSQARLSMLLAVCRRHDQAHVQADAGIHLGAAGSHSQARGLQASARMLSPGQPAS